MMTTRLLLALVLTAFLNLGITWAQTSDTSAKIRTKVEPKVSKISSLGDKMSVIVKVGKDGEVVAVLAVFGPDSVCSNITTQEVVKLRDAAREAALFTHFDPARNNGLPVESVEVIEFEFPTIGSPIPKPDPLSISLWRSQATTQTPGLVAGKPKSIPKPPYPTSARPLRAAGAVSVQVVIETDGNVWSALPVSGHPLLRNAARDAACRATFTPTYVNGAPIRASAILTYNFVP